MDNDHFEDVLEFMQKFQPRMIRSQPGFSSIQVQKLRLDLIEEELKELRDALMAKDYIEVVDAICDLLYVTYGTAIAFGVDIRPVWAEIHRTNMLKEGGGTREDGKILKPKDWQAPDIKSNIKGIE